MTTAAIAGCPASLDEAVDAAARLLGASRAPLIAGLGTDYEGVQAAVRLARGLRAVIDPMHGAAVQAELDAAAAGLIAATPPLAHAEADVALLIGPGAALPPGRRERRVVVLCPGRDGAPHPAASAPAPAQAQVIAAPAGQAAALLGALRALLAGRPVRLAAARRAALADAAETLRGARYGVAVWRAAALETLAVDQAVGLVRDLNARLRWATLAEPPADNAAGVAAALAALCGAPGRISFAAGAPAHDPWRHDAARLAEAGEIDAALWLSALSPRPPDWDADVKLVALMTQGARLRTPPAVQFAVGCPGIDHDAVLYDPALGQLAFRAAAMPSAAPRATDVLHRIAQRIAQAAGA